MRIVIKYATRGRPKHFFDGLDNIMATANTDDIDIYAVADADDHTMNNPDVKKYIEKYRRTSLHFTEPVSKIHAINEFTPSPEYFDLLINFSDDMRFVVQGWDEIMIYAIKRVWGASTDFFAHFSDGYVHEKLPTMNICGSDYYKRFGYIYHPSYGSVSCDAENMWVAMMLGKHHYFGLVLFNHVHPANCRFRADETYIRNDRFGASDTKNYFERMLRFFDVPEKDRVCVPEQLEKEMVLVKAKTFI